MKLWEQAALGALLLGATCSACQPQRVPSTPRPDTRKITIVHLDSATLAQTMLILHTALPNETSVCYFGELRDTTVWLEGKPNPTVAMHLSGVRESVQDSADEMHVYYSTPRAGCPHQTLAIGHSHPYAGGGLCTHSTLDANVLFLSPQVFVSFVWCGDGRVQLLFQDGRREDGRFRDP